MNPVVRELKRMGPFGAVKMLGTAVFGLLFFYASYMLLAIIFVAAGLPLN